MITVVNIKHFRGQFEYCGRANHSSGLVASPLANPFKLRDEADRERVLARYRRWFYSKVNDGDFAVGDELARLINLAQAGDLNLGCYCAPKLCHCDIIKEFIEVGYAA